MASLNVRSGVLGKRLAAHLLRRATYYVTPSRIDYFATLTAAQAVVELFTIPPLKFPDGPVTPDGTPYFSLDDPYHEPGGSATNAQHFRAIQMWRIHESMYDTSVKWRFMNFVSSIFSTTRTFTGDYHFWRLIERFWGSNFVILAQRMTFDNQMLRYLNNNQNNASSPNENYAREFLELFTILKGDTIDDPNSAGNYTNYTEEDISQAARVFSGIKNSFTNLDAASGIVCGLANINQHDQGDKIFSAAFGNQTITGATTENGVRSEVLAFINLVFDQLETSRAFVRRLYRYYVSKKITAEIETDIIEPLAIEMKAGTFVVKNVLRTLFRSEHFYDVDDSTNSDEIIGAKIKSPYELLYLTANMLDTVDSDMADYEKLFYTNYIAIGYRHIWEGGLDMRGPLTVEGYPGFSDGPGYSRNWFTSNLLYERFTYGISFKRGLVRNTNLHFPFKVDLIAFVENYIDDPTGPGTPTAPIGAADANHLLNEFLTYLIPELPTGSRLDYFRRKLLGGLSPINWYFTWAEYKTTGDSQAALVGLERLYDAVTSSLEFQTY